MAIVRVGVEAAGTITFRWSRRGPDHRGWELVELNPAHVTAQRRVNGHRGIKIDRHDLRSRSPTWGDGKVRVTRGRAAPGLGWEVIVGWSRRRRLRNVG